MLAVLLAAVLATPKQFTLAAVGDVMLGRWVGRHIARSGPASALSFVRSDLAKADLVYGNLECALTDRPFATTKPVRLRAKPADAEALKGFQVLSLVNNHAGDAGPEGVTEAAENLRKRSIEPLTDATPVYQTVQGIKVGWVALIDLPGYPLDPDWEKKLADARHHCDVLIVAIHWGEEGSRKVSTRQSELAKRFAAAGVDLVLGSHPHVLEPIEQLPRPTQNGCLVAYSLGNFVFDAPKGSERRTEIMFVTFSKTGLSSVRTKPCHIVGGYPVPG